DRGFGQELQIGRRQRLRPVGRVQVLEGFVPGVTPERIPSGSEPILSAVAHADRTITRGLGPPGAARPGRRGRARRKRLRRRCAPNPQSEVRFLLEGPDTFAVPVGPVRCCMMHAVVPRGARWLHFWWHRVTGMTCTGRVAIAGGRST